MGLLQGFQVQKWSRWARIFDDFWSTSDLADHWRWGYWGFCAQPKWWRKTPSMIPFEVAITTFVTHQVLVGIIKPRVALDHSIIGAAPELVPDNDETVILQDAGDCLGWGLDFWSDTPWFLETELHVFAYACCRPTMGIATDVEIRFKPTASQPPMRRFHPVQSTVDVSQAACTNNLASSAAFVESIATWSQIKNVVSENLTICHENWPMKINHLPSGFG